jgi:hypothetical protein
MKPERRITYVLHYEFPDGTILHYVGGTTPARLKERLREHRKATTRTRTTYLKALGGTFRLTGLFPGHTEAIDKCLSQTDGGRALCLICSPDPRKTVTG